jgi:hypothetical protein
MRIGRPLTRLFRGPGLGAFGSNDVHTFADGESGAAPPDPAADTLRIIARLRAGGRPSAAELSGAAVLERWRLFAGEPYMLQGWVGMSLKSGVAFALDIGWARLIDRWVRLGGAAGVPPDASNEAVMEAAMRALERDDRRPQSFHGEGAQRARGDAACWRHRHRPEGRVQIAQWRNPGSV